MTSVQTAAAPAAALSLGVSNTAAFNYSSPIVAYINVSFSSWTLSFSLLRLDSLMSNPSQNSGTYKVSWMHCYCSDVAATSLRAICGVSLQCPGTHCTHCM